MDYSFAREFAETFRASTPSMDQAATFSQTPCFLPSLALRVPRKACSSLNTSRTSGQITTRPSSRGKKTSAARGLGSPIATANVSADVAILSAQLRGRISRAQFAGLFDSLFESHRQLTTQIWQSSPLGGSLFRRCLPIIR